MVAVRYADIDRMDNAYSFISSNAKIHPSVLLEPFSVIEEGVEIGENTLIGPYNHIRPGTKIGTNCRIGGHNTFEGKCSVGNFVRIGTHCNITWGAIVEDYVDITGHFTGANDKRIMWQREGAQCIAYHIKRGARIGLRTVLLDGITIGEEAFIGTGSIITHDIPDFEVWFSKSAASKQGTVPEHERLRL